jgi:hypothetical protein
VAKKPTKKPKEGNLAQAGYHSVVADNLRKARRHVQYSVVAEKLEMTETQKIEK